jgi:hypothetical protein
MLISTAGSTLGSGGRKLGWRESPGLILKAGLLHVANDKECTSKDSENRTIPLTNEFHESSLGIETRRNSAWHGHLAGRAKYRYDFQRSVRSHFARCAVDLDIHGMRRSFASNLVSEGDSIFIVAQWLGDGVQVVQKHYAYLASHSGSINRLVA